MMKHSSQIAHPVGQRTNTMHKNGLKTKHVIFKAGKTVFLANKDIQSKVFNADAISQISNGETVSVLMNGMSRVQIARISKLLNERGAKITIINK